MNNNDLNETNNSNFSHSSGSNLDSDILGNQFEISAINIPIHSSNQLSSQIDNIR